MGGTGLGVAFDPTNGTVGGWMTPIGWGGPWTTGACGRPGGPWPGRWAEALAVQNTTSARTGMLRIMVASVGSARLKSDGGADRFRGRVRQAGALAGRDGHGPLALLHSRPLLPGDFEIERVPLTRLQVRGLQGQRDRR